MLVKLASTRPYSLPICLLFVVLTSVGCGALADSKPELTIFAASSLTDAFEELGEEFEEQNPDVEVRFNFAGSSVLLAQLQQGATVDVFASADPDKMEAAEKDGLVRNPRLFAKNSPVLVVPEGNPADVDTLQDLAKPDLTLVLAQNGVPIAGYTAEILTKANARYGRDFEGRIMENVVSRETDVRTSANRIAFGEADATFVYASDVTPKVRDKVEVVSIPEELNVAATYPIAITSNAPAPGLARDWTELVLSDRGQLVMEEWGFRRAR